MQLHAAAAAAAVFTLSLFLLPAPTHGGAHNITAILEKIPEFSTFNHHLTQTGLAAEINRRRTITVCAVNNTAMDVLTSKNYGIGTVKNLLSFLVLLDYYDAQKLHQITGGSAVITSLYQTTGLAQGAGGAVNITLLSHGRVGFWPENLESVNATFVKEIKAIPYNISVIQISGVLFDPEAEAPVPAPAAVNLTESMSTGCKVFADTLAAEKPAQQAFDENVVSGLTLFCPGDAAMTAFLPAYKNLSDEGKQSLLEYHGVPLYNSMQDLGTSNGKKMMTLATVQGKSNYALEVDNDGANNVTVQNKLVTATVVATLKDSSPQFAIYQLDKVLLPEELFNKTAHAPTPAPAPGPVTAGSPGPSPGQKSPPAPPAPPSVDSPAPGPDGDVADNNGAAGEKVGRFGAAVVLSFFLYFFL